MTVKEFLTISSIAIEPEVIRTKLNELRKPYQLGQYKTPDTLNDINMGELMQLQSIETEHDILFVPCTVLMGLSKRYISQLPATDVLGFVQWVAKEVERINKLFASTNVPPTPEEKQAGSELLNFGPFERKLQFLLGIHADFQLHFSLFANEKLQRVNAGVYRNLLCLCLSGCYQHNCTNSSFQELFASIQYIHIL